MFRALQLLAVLCATLFAGAELYISVVASGAAAWLAGAGWLVAAT